jgi:hypothetical protein
VFIFACSGDGEVSTIECGALKCISLLLDTFAWGFSLLFCCSLVQGWVGLRFYIPFFTVLVLEIWLGRCIIVRLWS